MCQISVEIHQNGNRETILEGVTRLEVKGNGVVLNTFFEEPLEVPDAVITSIDFLGGAVILRPSADSTGKTSKGERDE